jgi:adenine-specific DNA methylase
VAIPKECKRLAEVDFPIAVVSKHAAREKSIRHGHPSTLHLWWARRPLAACRAMLLGLLLPDPGDASCPEEFKVRARELLPRVQGHVGAADAELRRALLRFIGDFANWDLSSNAAYLAVARGLVQSVYPEEPPLVVDPFAGGGSIPLEALRLGCEAFASDLNPVACLILKVMLEDIPRHGPQLAEDLRRVGAEIKRQADKALAGLYPPDPDGATPIAYLWARTVQCEAPNCGAEIPLVRSFWLCKKANRRRALKPRGERPRGEPPRVAFEVFEPKAEQDVPAGTVTRARATCLCCGTVLPPERVRAQLAMQRGGADVIFDAQGHRTGGAWLLVVVTLRSDDPGRHYRLPTERDYDAVCQAQERVAKILAEWEGGGKKGLCPVPDEPVDEWHHDVNRMPMYGMPTWGDLFTARQKLSLVTLSRLVRESTAGSAEAIYLLMAIIVNRCADYNSANCRWVPRGEYIGNTLTRQALPFVWDFCEIFLTGDDATGGYKGALEWVTRVIEAWPASRTGQVQQVDAAEHPLPDQSVTVWFTDPPYYDAIDYAHCSDFFFVWVKRLLPDPLLLRDPWDSENSLTPKRKEIVVDSTTTKGHGVRTPGFYEEAMARAFAEGRRVLREDHIGAVVFAHKTTEGWEALLSGMIRGGWTITGSWPIATEMGSRLRARESAALATSVHLVCRPRPDDAPIGDWGEVLRELPRRVGDWMARLQAEGVRGADLVFACIGPALEIFSRSTKVETAEGQEVTLPEYLEKVWEVVGRTALEQVLGSGEVRARNGAAGALEEDARLTALFLWTLQSTNGQVNGSEAESETEGTDEVAEDEEEEAPRGKQKGFSLVFDVVRRFAQPLGIHLPTWESRIIETKKGVVRLMGITERAKQLFGDAGAQAVADQLERSTAGTAQLTLFPDRPTGAVPRVRGRGRRRSSPVDVADESLSTQRGATTLDRVHAAMLLQSSGRTNALRALLAAEQERGPDFLRLANALSALYPRGSEEKRLLDAMFLAVPR